MQSHPIPGTLVPQIKHYSKDCHQAPIIVINKENNHRNNNNTFNKKYMSNNRHNNKVPTCFSAWLTTLQNSAVSIPTNDSCGAIRLTKTLPGLSREYGNLFYKGCIGNLLSCSLRRTNKKKLHACKSFRRISKRRTKESYTLNPKPSQNEVEAPLLQRWHRPDTGRSSTT